MASVGRGGGFDHKRIWKTIDTILMGRRTYEVATRQGRGGGGNLGVKTYVFSRTLKAASDAQLEIISEDAASFVRRIKLQEGKDICLMGGGSLAQSLFEADLIDEIGLNIHPVLLGSGIPLFLGTKQQSGLELIECRPFKDGVYTFPIASNTELVKVESTSPSQMPAHQ